MGPEVGNKNKDCVFNGPYAGRDLYITMYQDFEREFVVTHNANIRPVSYFTGRETELQDLRQRIEVGRKLVLVSGMGGIGKTHICRKIFEEYLKKHAEDKSGPFRHIGYIEYSGDMDSSLQSCLKFKQQDRPEQNQEAAWRELEYLAADGKLLLFVDNVDKPISADLGLQKLKEILGAVVLTSRQTFFGDEFELCRIGFLDVEQCIEIYEKIRFGGNGKKVGSDEIPDLKYVIESLAGKHTITVEFMAHLARIKLWTVKKLRNELEQKGFRLQFHKGGKLVNIQESYEKLYDMSELTEAEQNILEAFSVFPYIPLAAETCNEWLLTDAGVSEDDDIMMGLYQKGWLQFSADQESYALHPVFSQFIYEKCKPEAKRHFGLFTAIQNHLGTPKDGMKFDYSKYCTVVASVVKKIKMGKGMEQLSFLSFVSCILPYIIIYKMVVEMKISVLGEYHLSTADSYANLANMHLFQKEYEEAIEAYNKALHIYDCLHREDEKLILFYDNIGASYKGQQKYVEAVEAYKRSLHLRIQFDKNIPNGYYNIAKVYEEQGNHAKHVEMMLAWMEECKLENKWKRKQ